MVFVAVLILAAVAVTAAAVAVAVSGKTKVIGRVAAGFGAVSVLSVIGAQAVQADAAGELAPFVSGPAVSAAAVAIAAAAIAATRQRAVVTAGMLGVLVLALGATAVSIPQASTGTGSAPATEVTGRGMGPAPDTQPGSGGVEPVEGADDPDVACPEQAASEACLISFFRQTAREQGTSAAIAQAVEHQIANPTSMLVAHCHNVLHETAAIGYEQAGEDPMVALAFGDQYPDACSFGYFHGVWQAYIGEFTLPELRDSLTTLCTDHAAAGSYEAIACFHAVGHRMTQLDRDPEVVLESAAACRDLDGVVGATDNCLSGVFMEYFIDMDHVQWVHEQGDVNRALEPCPGLDDEKLIEHCYREAGTQLAILSEYQPSVAYDLCDQQARPGSLEFCYRGFGNSLAVYAGYSPERSVELCVDAVDGDRLDVCIHDTALATVLNNEEADTARWMCTQAASEGGRERCRENVDMHARYYREVDAHGNPTGPFSDGRD